MTSADDYLHFRRVPAPAIEPDENGVDLALIRANLKLTPLERVQKGHRARQCMVVMRKARLAGSDSQGEKCALGVAELYERHGPI